MLGTCLQNVREKGPLVHNITNYVTVNDVANVILACGASPIMSDEPQDVQDITAICGGLNINIGTLNVRTIEGMLAAGHKANELNHMVLLDPVGAGASSLRTNTAVNLMQEIKFDVIRGNISEIKTLAAGSGTTKGVDADVADAVTEDNLDEAVAFAKAFSEKSGSIVAITGAIDLVSDGRKCYVIRNGRPEMGRITGTGCQLSGLMTAYLVANPEQKLEAAAAAVCTMGLAGEIGWSYMQKGDGNSTYRYRIIDAIYNDHDAFLQEAKEIKELCAKYQVPFVLDDDVELALEVGADGVHVGQSDMEAGDVRAKLGEDKIVGVSAQTVEQALLAQERGADYLGVGAVFPTSSKDDAVEVDHEMVKAICEAVDIPVIAIGGITKDNVQELSGCGLCGIAVISAIFAKPDIKKATEELKAATEKMVKAC